MTTRHRRSAGWIAAVFLLVGMAGQAQADDVAGSSDHPMVGRFQGSEILFYKAAADDQAALLQAPHDYMALLARNAVADRSGPEWLQLEGKITKIRYRISSGHSSFEVMKSYAAALTGKGFKPLFACADAACFTGKLTDDYLLGQQLDPDNGVTTRYSSHARYLLAELDQSGGGGPGSEASGGPVYASILVGEDGDITTAFVEVVETAGTTIGDAGAGDAGKIAVLDSTQMAQRLNSGQGVNIYGLLFDFDSAVLKPESKPTLDQIAKLLSEQPQLRLNVVGHTDNQGSADYNLDLSRRRAAAVVEALTATYGVAGERLSPLGEGFNQPIASNDTDEGRAKNRRVELVAQ